MTLHDSGDHHAESSPPPHCPPYTHYTGSICNLGNEYIYIYILYIDIETGYYNGESSFGFSVTNPREYFGAFTLVMWLNIQSNPGTGTGWKWLINDNNVYTYLVHINGTYIELLCLNQHNNDWIRQKAPYSTNEWQFYGVSCGRYMDYSFVLGNTYIAMPNNGNYLYNSGGSTIYIGESGWITKIKELGYYSESMNINQMRNMKYQNLDSLLFHRFSYLDFKKYGIRTGTHLSPEKPLRCPLNTLLTHAQDACILKGNLAITSTFSLITSYMGIVEEGSLEMTFKVLKWGENNLPTILIKFEDIFLVQIIQDGNEHKLSLFSLDNSGKVKFNVTAKWNILLGVQYPFAVAIGKDSNQLNVYLNRELQILDMVNKYYICNI